MNALWLKFLPASFRTRLHGRLKLQAILSNSGWLFADKVLKSMIGLFVGVWIARYLGPLQFGQLNYAIAFVSLFGALATLGLESIVVRELVRSPEGKNEILGSVFVLRFFGGALAFGLAVLVNWLLSPGQITTWLVVILAAGMILQAFDFADYLFQAEVRSKISVLARNSGFLLVALLKICLILTAASLIAFAWAAFLEVFFSAVGLLTAFRIHGHSMFQLRPTRSMVKSLFCESWPLLLAGLTIMLYMRIDQIMLGRMTDNEEVGFYSAAVRISECWYMLPAVILSSIYPSMVKLYYRDEKKYTDQLELIMGVLFWVGLVIAVFVALYSDQIIRVLYGSKYCQSAGILAVHTFSGIIVSMSVIFSQRFTLQGKQIWSLYGTVVGAGANIILNILLIPRYAGLGAAWATLLSYSLPMLFQSFLFDWQILAIFLRAPTRPIAYLLVKERTN